MRKLLSILLVILALPALAAERFVFPSIDGGDIDLAEYAGRPVLVVNTASRCAFTPQYDALQMLYDQYRDQGLVVLAVPSNDFRQELKTAEQVKDFCELNFDLDMPMTDITHVRGDQAHPFFKWVKGETGFEPAWNFNKILIGPDGGVVGTFGSMTRPLAKPITDLIEAGLS
ncbi:MAG: glutathione peroxidase [Pseudomonadota bacterium]|nr:glutathione peroxidase [Pseudomonadota bacterium]